MMKLEQFLCLYMLLFSKTHFVRRWLDRAENTKGIAGEDI